MLIVLFPKDLQEIAEKTSELVSKIDILLDQTTRMSRVLTLQTAEIRELEKLIKATLPDRRGVKWTVKTPEQE